MVSCGASCTAEIGNGRLMRSKSISASGRVQWVKIYIQCIDSCVPLSTGRRRQMTFAVSDSRLMCSKTIVNRRHGPTVSRSYLNNDRQLGSASRVQEEICYGRALSHANVHVTSHGTVRIPLRKLIEQYAFSHRLEVLLAYGFQLGMFSTVTES